MEKNTLFEWTATCQQAFDNLRNCLMTSPVLAYPDYSKHFLLVLCYRKLMMIKVNVLLLMPVAPLLDKSKDTV